MGRTRRRRTRWPTRRSSGTSSATRSTATTRRRTRRRASSRRSAARRRGRGGGLGAAGRLLRAASRRRRWRSRRSAVADRSRCMPMSFDDRGRRRRGADPSCATRSTACSSAGSPRSTAMLDDTACRGATGRVDACELTLHRRPCCSSRSPASAACKRETRDVSRESAAVDGHHDVAVSDLHPGGGSPPAEPIEYAVRAERRGAQRRQAAVHARTTASVATRNGGGGMGPALIDEQWSYGHEADQIYRTILEGRPNGMPAFARQDPRPPDLAARGLRPIDERPGAEGCGARAAATT